MSYTIACSIVCAVSGTTHGMFTLRPGATLTPLIHTLHSHRSFTPFHSYRSFAPFIRTVQQMADGETAEVHTPFTTRAKELLELYNGLALPLLTVDERLDVLLHGACVLCVLYVCVCVASWCVVCVCNVCA